MRVLSVLIVVAALATMPAHAEHPLVVQVDRDIATCHAEARLARVVAQSRDAGMPRAEVEETIAGAPMREVRRYSRRIVTAVYLNPNMTPDQFHTFALASCIYGPRR